MSTSIIGNDLVDLRDQEVAPESLHPRFDGRVMTPRECDVIEGSSVPTAIRWVFWAIKEAAYKAVRQGEPRVVFSPRRIEVVEFQGSRAVVNWEGRILDAWFRVDDQYAHAVVAQGIRPEGTIRGCTKLPIGQEPGNFVRDFALGSLRFKYGLTRDSIGIVLNGRIPRLMLRGGTNTIPVSFSHHGRFVAFASAPVSGMEDET